MLVTPTLSSAMPARVAVAPARAPFGPLARRDVRDLGRAPARLGVPVVATLAYRHRAELEALVALQNDRRSPMYRRFLTNEQFEAYFAPTPDDYARTLATLRAAGFTIAETTRNRTLIDAIAPTDAIEKTFGTEIHRVAQLDAGERVVATRPLQIPQTLRPLLESVTVGNLIVARPTFRLGPNAGRNVVDARTLEARRIAASGRKPDGCFLGIICSNPTPTPTPTATPTPRPSATPTVAPTATPTAAPTATPAPGGSGAPIGGPLRGPDNGYGPVAVANGYDLPVQHGFNGTGRATGVAISGDYGDADLATYLAYFGIARTGTTTRVEVDGGATYNSSFSGSNASVEATLDVETIVGNAPGTHLYMYLFPDLSSQHIEDGYNKAVADNAVDVINSSFGGCETSDTAFTRAVENIAIQGAAKGITFAASSGDSGSAQCGTSFLGLGGSNGVSAPASAPHFVAVGGTTFNVTATGAYASETAWRGSGGGVSTQFAEPSYQAGVAGASSSGRNVPDVAYGADPNTGTSLYFGGAWNGPIGGTSWASPIFSAVQTEIDQRQAARAGFVNPRVYNAFAARGYTVFHDITSGSNGAFSAGPGYDDVTGIGSTQSYAFSAVE